MGLRPRERKPKKVWWDPLPAVQKSYAEDSEKEISRLLLSSTNYNKAHLRNQIITESILVQILKMLKEE